MQVFVFPTRLGFRLCFSCVVEETDAKRNKTKRKQREAEILLETDLLDLTILDSIYVHIWVDVNVSRVCRYVYQGCLVGNNG